MAKFAEERFPLLDFGPKVDAYAEHYPIAWIRAALEAADAANKRRWDYVLGILKRFNAQGGPDRPKAEVAAPRAATRPVEYFQAQGPRKRSRPFPSRSKGVDS